MTPEIFSIFPCPYGCRESGGLSDTLTEKYDIIAAIRSIEEWIASDKILTEPLISPTASFIRISKVLDAIERRAILTLELIIVSDFRFRIFDILFSDQDFSILD